MDALARNRRSQAMRFTILKRRLSKQRTVDPAVSALSDTELESRIRLAAESLRHSPRSGVRRWLLELVHEKNRRGVTHAASEEAAPREEDGEQR
jgi:hypothetical protein